MRPSVCIIAFSPVARDGRVLRQIEYLAPHYDLTAIGIGPAPAGVPGAAGLTWRRLPEGPEESRWLRSLPMRAVDRAMRAAIPILNGIPALAAARGAAYERCYWSELWYRAALAFAVDAGCDAYHANDWTALPVAAEAARRLGARLVFDAHEYAPLEHENRPGWHVRERPVIEYFLRKYLCRVDGFTTVCEPIGRRYQEEFGVAARIVHNAPKRVDLPARARDPAAVRLVHHGAAVRDRRLDKMILALAAAEPRFSLHLMLVPGHPGYVEELEALAQRVAPGRVAFHPPVPPGRTAEAVAAYDLGFYVLEPCSYNNLMAAPNKFFDYIAAGMPVCIGPSPAMAEIVRRYGLGLVAPSFDPAAVAATLDTLDGPALAALQQGARRAAGVFHADAEMAKLVSLYREILPAPAPAARAGSSARCL
jgi:glycosyltransferase involved in cell wall biosynthesis